MKRLLAFAIATAFLVAMPVLALLAPYATFAPAPGPVEYYELRVRSLAPGDTVADERFTNSDAIPVVEFGALPQSGYWVDVRACAEDPVRRCGEWSPIRTDCADFDGDGTVGPRDLLAVIASWGTDHDAADLILLQQHWRAKTVQVADSGLWRYAD